MYPYNAAFPAESPIPPPPPPPSAPPPPPFPAGQIPIPNPVPALSHPNMAIGQPYQNAQQFQSYQLTPTQYLQQLENPVRQSYAPETPVFVQVGPAERDTPCCVKAIWYSATIVGLIMFFVFFAVVLSQLGSHHMP